MTTTVAVVEGVPSRRRHAAGCDVIRRVAADVLHLDAEDVDVQADAAGRPVVIARQGGQAWCTVAHTGDLVVAAVSGHGPVGVDAERADRAPLPPRRLWCAQGEPRGEDGADAVRRWTCKEAVAKALGVGLALPLGAVVVRGDDATVVGDPHGAWRLRTRTTASGVLVTVAVQGDGAVRWVSPGRVHPAPRRRRSSRPADAASRPSPR